MPNQSPFFTTGSSGRLLPQRSARSMYKSSKSEKTSSSKSQRQLSKKDINASSISKRFFHLTRRLGNGLSSSTSKHLNEKPGATSFKEKRDLPQSQAHLRSSKTEQMYNSKQKSQRYSRSSGNRIPSTSRKTYDIDDEHEFLPNNGTSSTTDASTSDELSTVLSEEYSASHYIPHSFKAGKHTFIVDSKYSFLRVIGHGAYGVVISSHDNVVNENVAIKMIPKAFHDEIDAKRILREIKLLKHFKHENIVSIKDMMPPLARYVEDFNDVYITTDLMETDLHRIIYSKQSLSIDHVQYFIYQILRALKYIHSANVLHRDLKPSNLLVNSNCDLKVCDFGLARGISSDDEMLAKRNEGSMLLTEYVVTRWYRAPEIMLSCHEYTKPIDLWSVGCIFAELIARKPYFPGEDYIDQLTIISQKLGKLQDEDLDFVTSEKARRFMRKLPDKPTISLRRQFPGTPPEALDLLGKLLRIHPEQRITVEEALEHEFLAPLHNPRDEPVAESAFDFKFEEEDLHRVRLQELIWQEVGSFRPSCLPVAPRRGRMNTSSKLYEA